MGDRAGKRRKQYVDRRMGELKNCLIQGPRHYYDKCKVLGDFGDKYVKGKTTKYHGNHTTPRKIFNRQQENNAIIKNLVDEILLNES